MTELQAFGSAVIASIMGGLGVLWKLHLTSIKDQKERSTKLENRLDKNGGEMLQMTERIGNLEGRQAGIESLSAEVLDTVSTTMKEIHDNSKSSGTN